MQTNTDIIKLNSNVIIIGWVYSMITKAIKIKEIIKWIDKYQIIKL